MGFRVQHEHPSYDKEYGGFLDCILTGDGTWLANVKIKTKMYGRTHNYSSTKKDHWDRPFKINNGFSW